MHLESNHLFIIGILASVLVWAVKQLAERKQTIPSAYLTIGVYAVSFVLAVVWSPVQFPSLPAYAGDPVAFVAALFQFAQSVLGIVGGYVAFAVLVYQAFVKALLEKGLPTAKAWLTS